MFSQDLLGPSVRRAARISSHRDFTAGVCTVAGPWVTSVAGATAAARSRDSPYGVSEDQVSSGRACQERGFDSPTSCWKGASSSESDSGLVRLRSPGL